MNIYFVVYGLLCTLSILFSFCYSKGKAFIYLLACFVLSSICCFSDISIRHDVPRYYSYFVDLHSMEWGSIFSSLGFRSNWEPGYVIFQKLLSYLIDGSDAESYILFMGLVCLLPTFYYIKRNATDPMIALLIFFTFNFIGAGDLYRAWIALMITLCSHQYIIERNIRKFLMILVIASMFHRSALALVPVYCLYTIRPTANRLFSSFFVAVFLGVTADKWLMLFRLFSRRPLNVEFRGGISMLIFLWLVLGLVFFMARRKLDNSRFRLWFTMVWMAAITQPLCFTFSLWSRLQMFYMIALWTLLPATLDYYLRLQENMKLYLPVRIAFLLFLGIQVYFRYRNEIFIFGNW